MSRRNQLTVSLFAVSAVMLGACGRVRYATAGAPDSAMQADPDAWTVGEMDAGEPDAYAQIDGPSDGGMDTPPDAPRPSDAPPLIDAPPDAASTPSSVVTNTNSSGPGSLSAAVDFVNAGCGVSARRITFDIPVTDLGLVTVGPNRFWRILGPARIVLSCPGTVIDGTTQTARHGNLNTASFGGIPVGAAGVPLPVISGPEIELRGIDLNPTADSVTVSGLAARSFLSETTGHVIGECLFGSEPTALTPLPVDLRPADNTLLYLPNGRNTVRANVFVWQPGVMNRYNGASLGGSGVVFQDNYMTGQGGGGAWDELHANPASGISILHNYFGGFMWEFHIEWVSGVGGEVSQNTFVDAAPVISMGGAGTMVGNVTIPTP